MFTFKRLKRLNSLLLLVLAYCISMPGLLAAVAFYLLTLMSCSIVDLPSASLHSLLGDTFQNSMQKNFSRYTVGMKELKKSRTSSSNCIASHAPHNLQLRDWRMASFKGNNSVLSAAKFMSLMQTSAN